MLVEKWRKCAVIGRSTARCRVRDNFAHNFCRTTRNDSTSNAIPRYFRLRTVLRLLRTSRLSLRSLRPRDHTHEPIADTLMESAAENRGSADGLYLLSAGATATLQRVHPKGKERRLSAPNPTISENKAPDFSQILQSFLQHNFYFNYEVPPLFLPHVRINRR